MRRGGSSPCWAEGSDAGRRAREMDAIARQEIAAERARPARREPWLLARIARHWADYLYVAPALGVMLLVIGYPVFDTIYLSFFSTPPSLALSDKIFNGVG